MRGQRSGSRGHSLPFGRDARTSSAAVAAVAKAVAAFNASRIQPDNLRSHAAYPKPRVPSVGTTGSAGSAEPVDEARQIGLHVALIEATP